MQFYEPLPKDGETESSEYTAILLTVIERVEQGFGALGKQKGPDQYFSGGLQALRFLACELAPWAALCIPKSRVVQWRITYFEWFDSARIPKKYRDDLRVAMVQEFDMLEEVAGDLT